MAEFDHETTIDVRFRDLDTMGHVNNAVYATYLERGRVQYIEDVIGESLPDISGVVADLHIDFEEPIEYGQTVTVAVRAGDLGTSSVSLEYEVRADGDLAATAETRVVVVDPDTGDPAPVPDVWRERIRDHEDL